MFGKSKKETQQSDEERLQELLSLSSESTDEEVQLQNLDSQAMNLPEPDQPEVVNVVEKISGIVSPYFIVLVGLFLYEDNFLIGTGLITIGIFSLLKISVQDISKWVKSASQFLGLGEK